MSESVSDRDELSISDTDEALRKKFPGMDKKIFVRFNGMEGTFLYGKYDANELAEKLALEPRRKVFFGHAVLAVNVIFCCAVIAMVTRGPCDRNKSPEQSPAAPLSAPAIPSESDRIEKQHG